MLQELTDAYLYLPSFKTLPDDVGPDPILCSWLFQGMLWVACYDDARSGHDLIHTYKYDEKVMRRVMGTAAAVGMELGVATGYYLEALQHAEGLCASAPDAGLAQAHSDAVVRWAALGRARPAAQRTFISTATNAARRLLRVPGDFMDGTEVPLLEAVIHEVAHLIELGREYRPRVKASSLQIQHSLAALPGGARGRESRRQELKALNAGFVLLDRLGLIRDREVYLTSLDKSGIKSEDWPAITQKVTGRRRARKLQEVLSRWATPTEERDQEPAGTAR